MGPSCGGLLGLRAGRSGGSGGDVRDGGGAHVSGRPAQPGSHTPPQQVAPSHAPDP